MLFVISEVAVLLESASPQVDTRLEGLPRQLSSQVPSYVTANPPANDIMVG